MTYYEVRRKVTALIADERHDAAKALATDMYEHKDITREQFKRLISEHMWNDAYDYLQGVRL